MHLKAAAVAAVVAVCSLSLPAKGITSGVAVAAADSRFDAVGGFTLREWQGINNVFGNATLIAPDRVILARHLINSTFKNRKSTDGAAAQYVVRFRRRPDGGVGDLNDPSTFYHVRVKEWLLPTGRTDADDVVIGILDTSVVHIAPVTIDFKAKLSKNAPVTLASWGPEAPPTGVVPKGRLVVGATRVSSWSKTKFSLAAATTAAPSRPVLNDSGSPVLLVGGASVRLVGFITTTGGGVSVAQLDGSRLMPRRR